MGDAVQILWAKIRAIWWKSDMDDDFNEELESHLDLLTAEYEKSGMKPQEARRAAILRVGGLKPCAKKIEMPEDCRFWKC